MKLYKTNAIWIAWEHQRRSLELSKALGVQYFELTYYRFRIMRPLLLSIKTILLIYKERPQKVFVQNPSNVLAALTCFIKPFFRIKVIVDRHSNFIFSNNDAENYSKCGIYASNLLSKYSLKKSELTIVTNSYLKKYIEDVGGKAFVLADKLPELSIRNHTENLKGQYNVVFPCTFSPDEPVEEAIKAAHYLPKDIHIYITGAYQKNKHIPKESLPNNVTLTGFLCEDDYQKLLNASNVVLSLTTREHTLLCCAYESVAIHKPFILSNKKDLREYFYKGNIATENDADNIASAIIKSRQEYHRLIQEVNELKRELSIDWGFQFNELLSLLSIL